MNDDVEKNEKLMTYKAKLLNCNGLNEKQKRNKILYELQVHSPDFIILVDSRLSDCQQTRKAIVRTDAYRYEFAGTSSESKGVVILAKNSTNLKIVKVHRHEGGQFLFLEVIHELVPVLLVGVYGPSDSDDVEFWKQLIGKTESFNYENFVILGDFNFYLDHDLDTHNYVGQRNSKPRTAAYFDELMSEGRIMDAYRNLYPSTRSFTWKKWNVAKNPRNDKRSRIDHCFVSPRFI